jgi:hypothetical protein
MSLSRYCLRNLEMYVGCAVRVLTCVIHVAAI